MRKGKRLTLQAEGPYPQRDQREIRLCYIQGTKRFRVLGRGERRKEKESRMRKENLAEDLRVIS